MISARGSLNVLESVTRFIPDLRSDLASRISGKVNTGVVGPTATDFTIVGRSTTHMGADSNELAVHKTFSKGSAIFILFDSFGRTNKWQEALFASISNAKMCTGISEDDDLCSVRHLLPKIDHPFDELGIGRQARGGVLSMSWGHVFG